jgi:hypothetical protein
MALVGGGGAGNTAGSNPAGTGNSLNYIGDHAYAYSGSITVNNNFSDLLNFNTQNSYVVVSFQPFYLQQGETDNILFELLINGEVIASVELSDSSAYTPYQEMTILLPSFSTIQVQAKNLSGSGSRAVAASIVGRVYA